MSVAIGAGVYVVLGLGALVGVIPALIADLAPDPLSFLGLPIACVGLAIYLWTTWISSQWDEAHLCPLIRLERSSLVASIVGSVTNGTRVLPHPHRRSSRIRLAPDPPYGAVLFLLFHLFIVLVEEPDLKRRFGASYAAYCQSVPRWLPRLSALMQSIRDVRRPTRR